jgi:hypothetical protein
MPRRTKKPPTVAEVHALWCLLSAAGQAEFRRRIGKRRSGWDEIDALMLLVYDLYRERYDLRPIRYFKWIGALLDGNVKIHGKIFPGKIRFGPTHNAAWRRLYRKYTTSDYEKLARPAWFDDPKLIVLPPPLPSDKDPPPPAIGYPPPLPPNIER